MAIVLKAGHPMSFFSFYVILCLLCGVCVFCTGVGVYFLLASMSYTYFP